VRGFDRAGLPAPPALDACLAALLTASALTASGALSDPARALVLVVMTAAVAWSRRAPVTVLAIEVAGVLVLPHSLILASGIAFLIAAFSAALYSDRRLVVAALLLVAAVWLLAFGGQVTIPSSLVPILLLAPVWLAADAIRRGELRAEASAERANRLEQEREDTLRAERTRIARELHDVVTHSVTVMVMQTGAARQIMSRDEQRAQALLECSEASGRAALEELRRLLGVLSDHDDDVPLAPQPDVAAIPSLIEQVRAAGLPVELSVEGEPQVVSGGIGVAAYRIVQEALTNVVKHARGAPSRVIVRWADTVLELEVIDDGASQNGRVRNASGRGLAGMRERTAMYGGTFDAGPDPDRGYVVRARIPLGSTGA
jgi:signal transduction histidine kinase